MPCFSVIQSINSSHRSKFSPCCVTRRSEWQAPQMACVSSRPTPAGRPPKSSSSGVAVGNLDGATAAVLGSGAGLDGIIAAWKVGPTGKVIGLDLNPTMCKRARANAEISGTQLECREGRMESIPLEEGSVDVVISNGVINLSFQKRKVIEEIFRVLRPGGRISITDIVSAKQLKQSIVNDPKLWAS